MSPDCFSDYKHEEIGVCDLEEILSGLSPSSAFYAPVHLITKMEVPKITGSFIEAGTINQDIEFIENKGFKRIKLLIDMNELSTAIEGSLVNKTYNSTLEIFVLGFYSKMIGFMRKMRVTPCVYLIQDNNGRWFTIGTKTSPAYLNSFELTSGKKYEDNSGATAVLASKAPFFEYTGKITEEEVQQLGDWDSDWDVDWF